MRLSPSAGTVGGRDRSEPVAVRTCHRRTANPSPSEPEPVGRSERPNRRRQIGRGRLSAERHGAQERHGNGAANRDGREPVGGTGTPRRAVVARLARTCRRDRRRGLSADRHGVTGRTCHRRQTIRTARRLSEPNHGERLRQTVGGAFCANLSPARTCRHGCGRLSEPVGTVSEPVGGRDRCRTRRRLPRCLDRRQTIRTRHRRRHGGGIVGRSERPNLSPSEPNHATAHGNATGTARQIGTGANPSERRERKGGRLWRVWREPVGAVALLPSAADRARGGCALSPSEDCHGEPVGRLSEPNHGEPVKI